MGITIFGRNQTGVVIVSEGLNDRLASEIESNEKLLEKVFFPFLWYKFNLENNLVVASTSPSKISPAKLDVKCTPTLGSSIDIPYGSSNYFVSRLTALDKLKYGCTIGHVQGNDWRNLSQEKELLMDFGGTFNLTLKPIGFSQVIVFLLFYFIIAIPAAALVRKSLHEASQFVQDSKGS